MDVEIGSDALGGVQLLVNEMMIKFMIAEREDDWNPFGNDSPQSHESVTGALADVASASDHADIRSNHDAFRPLNVAMQVRKDLENHDSLS
jgi:hypothetical protein